MRFGDTDAYLDLIYKALPTGDTHPVFTYTSPRTLLYLATAPSRRPTRLPYPHGLGQIRNDAALSVS